MVIGKLGGTKVETELAGKAAAVAAFNSTLGEVIAGIMSIRLSGWTESFLGSAFFWLDGRLRFVFD